MLFQRALKGVGEVKKKEGVGKKKGRSGKDGVRRGEGICAIGFREDGRPCHTVQELEA